MNVDPKAIEEIRQAILAADIFNSDRAREQDAWGNSEGKADRCVHRCAGALRTAWSILTEEG